ncbi:MAG TPA: cytochrome c oxidase assembly protein [Xanthobacteraceae bacterium]|nr:cytochrome c oxidase assembly protein [Xanthobacteraceae bacterium]
MRRRTSLWTIALPASLMICAMPAHAHGPEGLWSGMPWTFDAWVEGPLYVCGAVYWLGTSRLWRRAGFGRGIGLWQSACFWSGWTALALALMSPLHWLGERLFAAHMLEHCILIAVAPPLIVIARPTAAMLWALPKPAAAAFVALAHRPPIAGAWGKLTSPLAATFVYGAVLWAWHMPVLYQLTLASIGWHRLEHVSFTLTALLFWWSLARGGELGVKLACLFVTTLHTSLLGLLLTLSPRAWYPAQGALAADWGLTRLQDQQLAGLVMWVPMGAVYVIAALWVASRWIGGASRAALHGAEASPT